MNTKVTIRLVPDGFFYNDTFVGLAAGSGYSHRLGDAILEVRERTGNDGIDDASVWVSTHRVMLIPEPEAYRAEYMFSQTFTAVDAEECILTQPVGTACVLVYAINKEVQKFFIRTFESVEFLHPFASLVESGLQCASQQVIMREKDRRAQMFLAVDAHFTDVVVAQDGVLQMATRFVATKAEDRLYYIMNAWQQLELDQLRDRLRLVSVTPESKSLLPMLSRYIKNI